MTTNSMNARDLIVEIDLLLSEEELKLFPPHLPPPPSLLSFKSSGDYLSSRPAGSERKERDEEEAEVMDEDEDLEFSDTKSFVDLEEESDMDLENESEGNEKKERKGEREEELSDINVLGFSSSDESKDMKEDEGEEEDHERDDNSISMNEKRFGNSKISAMEKGELEEWRLPRKKRRHFTKQDRKWCCDSCGYVSNIRMEVRKHNCGEIIGSGASKRAKFSQFLLRHLQCKTCKLEFKSTAKAEAHLKDMGLESNLTKHIAKLKEEKRLQRSVSGALPPKEEDTVMRCQIQIRWRCAICTKFFATYHSAYIHVRNVEKLTGNPEQDAMRVNRKSEVEAEEPNPKQEEKPFQCHVCVRRFLSKNGLDRHIRASHGFQ